MLSYICLVIQNLILGALIVASIAYLGKVAWNAFKAKSTCASGCGKCPTVKA